MSKKHDEMAKLIDGTHSYGPDDAANLKAQIVDQKQVINSLRAQRADLHEHPMDTAQPSKRPSRNWRTSCTIGSWTARPMNSCATKPKPPTTLVAPWRASRQSRQRKNFEHGGDDQQQGMRNFQIERFGRLARTNFSAGLFQHPSGADES